MCPKVWELISHLNSNISIYILHNFIPTFLKLLTRRICLTIKASLVGDHFLYSHDLNVWFWGDVLKRYHMLVKPLTCSACTMWNDSLKLGISIMLYKSFHRHAKKLLDFWCFKITLMDFIFETFSLQILH